MMVEQGDGGRPRDRASPPSYADAIRAAARGDPHPRPAAAPAGVYIVVTKNDFKFFADCTVNVDPTAEELAEIALATRRPRPLLRRGAAGRDALATRASARPRGASPREDARARPSSCGSARPELEMDGEIQVDIAAERGGPRPGVPVLAR